MSEKPWEEENPNEGHHKKMSPEQKAKAKARAKAHGRPYPNLVDNMAVMKEGSVSSFNKRYAKDKEKGDFHPPEGVQSAARKALKWIEEGHAGSGFTGVGRGRAHQLANGESVSYSTIKRMYSFFSRHEVDKQGKDWNKPSPGKVAWYAWGGDAGFSWARSIVNKHEKKKED